MIADISVPNLMSVIGDMTASPQCQARSAGYSMPVQPRSFSMRRYLALGHSLASLLLCTP